MLAVALAAAWPGAAWAGESVVSTAVFTSDAATGDGPAKQANQAKQVEQVSYTTDGSDQQLMWLPYRPSKDDVRRAGAPAHLPDGRAERLAQFAAPVASPGAETGEVDPFDDPFEDGKAQVENGKTRAKPILSGTTLQDDALEDSRAERLAPEKLPDVIIDEPLMEPDPLESAEPESVVVAPLVPEDPCSAVGLTPINQITHDISAPGSTFPKECPLFDGEAPDRLTHGWAPITFTWKASALCHKPAYFEQVHLEQYGHSCGPYLQPVISGAHFFLTVPVLPYKMGLYPPNECIYSLGYYRAGSCAPYMIDPLPISVRAALFEAAAWTGAALVIP